MKLHIVVPCFNEEPVLRVTAERLDRLLGDLESKRKIDDGSRVCFVDDGSQDRTWELILRLSQKYRRIRGIRLAKNRGHQAALLAGVFDADADAVVTIDADLQDDESVIEQMVDKCAEGFDIVYGVRADRSADSRFKRISALAHYRLLSAMGVEVVHNHADFRLMNRAAIDGLKEYSEVNVYVRGIVPLLGLRTASVNYDRRPRIAGQSKYPFSKMLALSVQGITSFSILPLRVIALLGLLISLLSVGLGGWAVATKLFTSRALPGWTSTVVPLYLLGGVQLLCLGVIGEYLGKIYMETKRRPRYMIAQTTERQVIAQTTERQVDAPAQPVRSFSNVPGRVAHATPRASLSRQGSH